MHGANIVAIVFKLINFGALIVLGVYLFKRYALGSIKLQISKRQQKLADLALQNQLLKEQAKAMELSIAEQRSVSSGLLQKIDLWQSLVAHDIEERNQEMKARQAALIKKMDVQQAYIQLRDVQKRALLPAIEKARIVLAQQYEALPLGQSFIGDVVKHMEKSKS